MENYIRQLREAINDYKEYGRLDDETWAKIDSLDKPDLNLEHLEEVYYKKHFDAMMVAVDMVQKLTGIDFKTAKKLVITKTDEVIALCEMVAA